MPTGEKDEEVEEYFSATLANVFDSSNGSFRIVLEDFYAKLGWEAEYRICIKPRAFTQSLIEEQN